MGSSGPAPPPGPQITLEPRRVPKAPLKVGLERVGAELRAWLLGEAVRGLGAARAKGQSLRLLRDKDSLGGERVVKEEEDGRSVLGNIAGRRHRVLSEVATDQVAWFPPSLRLAFQVDQGVQNSPPPTQNI